MPRLVLPRALVADIDASDTKFSRSSKKRVRFGVRSDQPFFIRCQVQMVIGIGAAGSDAAAGHGKRLPPLPERAGRLSGPVLFASIRGNHSVFFSVFEDENVSSQSLALTYAAAGAVSATELVSASPLPRP